MVTIELMTVDGHIITEVELSDEEFASIQRYCDKHEISVEEWVNAAIRSYLKEMESSSAPADT